MNEWWPPARTVAGAWAARVGRQRCAPPRSARCCCWCPLRRAAVGGRSRHRIVGA